MAHITDVAHAQPGLLARLHHLLVHMAEKRARTRIAEALLALPDSELTARDITREDLTRSLR
ncbi:hypothetical protein [Thalassococcus sp. S3]|uniref:hypothetical protein n=1 Tax=Thalassococcus sp. S3 TaxID=2017482 RepID=UPI00102420D2|nr:hypothetical protein [Thalassococcus sp. S3]QBF30591.1 hypothetical protein CFI11_05100 [Thalassococcus sp. S3]